MCRPPAAARRWALALLCWTLAPLAAAETVHVAVASNFAGAMERIASAFEAATGHEVTLSTGSSGRIYTQVLKGAPYDLFFSADREKPAALEREGLAVAGSRFTYARGALVLWSRKPGFVGDGRARLASGDYNKLALANPRLAPYGQAAVAALEGLGAARASRSRWVLGENIAHTFQYVVTGNADWGFVALSQVLGLEAAAAGSHWVVPAALYPPIRQDAALLRRGRDNPAARALLRFVRGEQAGAIIRELGYSAPPAAAADDSRGDAQTTRRQSRHVGKNSHTSRPGSSRCTRKASTKSPQTGPVTIG